MFCKNCGLEISSDAKFRPGCGIAVEDTEVENEVALSEKAEESAVSLDITENQQSDTEASIENKLDEAEKDTVQTQLADSLSEPEQAENIVVDSVNGSEQIEAAKSENSTTENIKEVFLPQKGKNGRVRFKDLSSKQKAIRLGIGGLLLLIGIIWIVSDGVKGSEKAIKVIPCNCDTGAVFNMTLEEFSKSFDNQVVKWEETDPNIYECWSSPSSGTEDSGTSYQFYSSKILDDTFIYAKVIDNHVAGIVIGMDYTSDTYKDNLRNSGTLFNYSVLAFGKMSDDEEQEMFKNLADGCDNSKTRTSYISDEVKYTIIPDRLNSTIIGYTLTIDPVSKEYVNSLDDNIIYNDFGDVNPDTEGAFGSEPPNKAEGQYNAKDQAMKDLVLYRLFQETAYPSGMEDAVRMGVYDDISLGDVIDYIFESPDFSVDRDGENYFVTISGRYRYSVGSDYVYSGSITYRISESGYVSVSSDPNSITEIIQSVAISMGYNY